MLRKSIAVILLLCHINTSMLLPQVAEDDLYAANGQQVDDINTLTEYVDQVILGNKDKTPEDEDDDNGQNFTAIPFYTYTYQPFYSIIPQRKETIIQKENRFPELAIHEPQAVFPEIVPPPPKV